MENLTVKTDSLLSSLNDLNPCRYIKDLENGNMAILQIVNPEAVPEITKWLRDYKTSIGKFFCSLEAGLRVGHIVYKNSMAGKSRKNKRGKK